MCLAWLGEGFCQYIQCVYLYTLYDDRRGATAAVADSSQSAFGLSFLQDVQKCHQYARSRCTERVSEGYRAAAYIDAVFIQFEVLYKSLCDNGKCFVDLEVIDIADLQSRLA